VVSVTQIHGGDALNVIPDEAVLRGTIRYFKPEIDALIETAMRRIGAGIGNTFGVQVHVAFDHHYPVTTNSAPEAKICHEAATSVLGPENVRQNEPPSMATEDFSFMLREKPGCYVWLGNAPQSGGHALHNPYYDFNDKILAIGISYWVKLIETALHPA
jgi:hippurate hydrolase